MAMAAAAAVAAGNRCMNAACGAAAPGVGEWRKGWPLRSGGFAVLCDKCGLAYEQLVFCDIFHQKESGWRDCSFCGKRLHCGCIASKYSFDLLDSGGVQCVTCIKNSAVKSSLSQMTSKLLTPQNNQRLFGKNDELMPGKILEIGHSNIISKQKEVENGIRQIKWEHPNISIAEMGRMPFLTMNQRAPYSSQCTPRDDNKDPTADSVRSESFSEACLSMSLGIANNGNKVELTSTLGRPVLVSPSTAIPDGREFAGALSPSQHAQKARHFLARPSRVGDCAAFDPMKDVLPHFRVARPPAEGKGRNQLLPRYWPRITDQELQQISGDSNSTIVPLFEKVLSASDAGRIGRLVLPKACAEAYFPPITQPEGRPLTIQDAKGKEWHFQFRFWPNNNSRMYVLEGVTPCIQSLQLQAGDTVTFSRIEPGGRLVMGFRKATNNINLPDSQISAIANGSLISETFFSSTYENLAITDKFGGRPDEGSFQLLQKRSRNIGSKSRRLLMDAEDVLELKLTWEEAQELLRPAPTAKPSVVMVEDYEFEEYDEPPVFAKRSIFTIRASGEQDQWIQCDDCSKWRQLPLNVIVASRWTCADKSSDPKRSPCSAPDELNSKQLQSILQQYEDIRRRKSSYSFKQNVAEIDACSFDAFATAAVLGDVANQAAASVATTTKHPRHRPGCTCIVCIQPPSGKGLKHNPACTCNVCMTVKRRYKTLMMRKKQRQSEREEAESSKKIPWMSKDEPEGSNLSRSPQTLDASRDGDVTMLEKHDINKGHIDLNFQPTGRDVDLQGGQPPVGMMTLLEVANRPLENYLKQNGLITLVGEQGSSSTGTVPQAPMESEERTSNMERLASVDQKRLEREQDSVGIDDAGENQDKDVTGAA